MRSSISTAILAALLLTAAAASGQTVPLEIWYGYLPAGTRVSLGFEDAKRGFASFSLGSETGAERRWRFRAPALAFYTPKFPGDNWRGRFLYSGAAQFSRRWRYALNQLQRDHYEFRQAFATSSYSEDRITWNFDQRLSFWSHDSVTVTPQNALRLLSNGPFLAPRQTLVEANYYLHRITFDERYDRTSPDGGQSISTGETLRRLDSLAVTVSRGISSRTQGRLAAGISRLNNPIERYAIDHVHDSLGQLVTNATKLLDSDNLSRRYSSGIDLSWLISSNCWIDLSSRYSRNMIDMSFVDRRTSNIGHLSSYAYAERENDYQLGFSFDWFSRRSEFSPLFLADNFSLYYRRPLTAGTFHVRAQSEWRRNDYATESAWRVDSSDQWQSSNSRLESRQLIGQIDLAYYFRPSTQISAQFRSTRRMIGKSDYYHQQFSSIYFTLEHSNILWNASTRREISWEQIVPLDYALGPLLRSGDYRVRLSVYPPTYYYLAYNSRDRFYEFFKGKSSRTWRFEAAGTRGVIRGFETSLTVNYSRQNSADAFGGELSIATISVELSSRWQPIQYFRLTSRLQSQATRLEQASLPGTSSNYWRLLIFGDLLIL